MKKRTKRLSLRRETVRSLEVGRLSDIVGGNSGGGHTYNVNECNTSCDCLDHPNTFSEFCTAECPC